MEASPRKNWKWLACLLCKGGQLLTRLLAEVLGKELQARSDFVALERNLTAKRESKMLKLSASWALRRWRCQPTDSPRRLTQSAGLDAGPVPALNIAIVSKLFMHGKQVGSGEEGEFGQARRAKFSARSAARPFPLVFEHLNPREITQRPPLPTAVSLERITPLSRISNDALCAFPGRC